MSRLESALVLAVFVALVLGVGAFIAVNTPPGPWYVALVKPTFHPPNWVFGPIWFSLYLFIAIAGWRIVVAAPNGRATSLWFCQMILNWFWAPVWFVLHAMWPAFFLIIAILLLTLAFMRDAWKVDRLAAALFAPYAAWVAFSGALNFSIALQN